MIKKLVLCLSILSVTTSTTVIAESLPSSSNTSTQSTSVEQLQTRLTQAETTTRQLMAQALDTAKSNLTHDGIVPTIPYSEIEPTILQYYTPKMSEKWKDFYTNHLGWLYEPTGLYPFLDSLPSTLQITNETSDSLVAQAKIPAVVEGPVLMDASLVTFKCIKKNEDWVIDEISHAPLTEPFTEKQVYEMANKAYSWSSSPVTCEFLWIDTYGRYYFRAYSNDFNHIFYVDAITGGISSAW
ncbi:MAG TPA: hypothetical protein VJ824_02810 [Bacillota bacterium]|nr:hypothetical protein [Bacillota bacterium]